jgi:hypothetical protein
MFRISRRPDYETARGNITINEFSGKGVATEDSRSIELTFTHYFGSDTEETEADADSDESESSLGDSKRG